MIVRLQQFVFLLNLDKITKKKQVNKKISYKNKQADMSIYFSFYKTLTNTLTRTSYIFFVYIKSNKHCTKENILL
jgi:hypothetical protein